MKEIITYRLQQKEYGAHTQVRVLPDSKFLHVMWDGVHYVFTVLSNVEGTEVRIGEAWKVRIINEGSLWPEENVLATGQRGREPIHLVGEKVDLGVQVAEFKDKIDA